MLVLDGFRYTLQREQHGRFVWRCWRRAECLAKVTTNIFDRTMENPNIRVVQAEDHVHPPDGDVDRARISRVPTGPGILEKSWNLK